MCSWINTDRDVTTDGYDVKAFSPQKKSKGIVFYQDRAVELDMSPELSNYSPKSSVNTTLSKKRVLNESQEPVKESDESHVLKLEMEPVRKRGRKKRV